MDLGCPSHGLEGLLQAPGGLGAWLTDLGALLRGLEALPRGLDRPDLGKMWMDKQMWTDECECGCKDRCITNGCVWTVGQNTTNFSSVHHISSLLPQKVKRVGKL